eukprot:COSAG04_NODE_186_length_21024_cov_6.326069_8_plen_550_part_00
MRAALVILALCSPAAVGVKRSRKGAASRTKQPRSAPAPAAEPEPLRAGDERHDFCIVGGGPGGVQLGHFLAADSRDYVIFERQPGPGHFFKHLPRHRQLISLNKRHTGRDSPEFNMRHDWNSLLDAPASVAPVTARSKARFPDAGVLVDYMRDFAAPQEAAGRILYDTTVLQVRRTAESVFRLDVEGTAGGPSDWWSRYTSPPERAVPSRSVQCNVVVMAHGLWVPKILPVDGIEYTEGYEEVGHDGEAFEAKAVAILGLGNSAFEVAGAASDYAAFTHMWPTRASPNGKDWPHASWESRYVGSLRAIRTGVLDGYLLKSLDVMPLRNFAVASPDQMAIRPCFDTKVCLFAVTVKKRALGPCTWLVHNRADEAQTALLEEIKASGIFMELVRPNQARLPRPSADSHPILRVADGATDQSVRSGAAERDGERQGLDDAGPGREGARACAGRPRLLHPRQQLDRGRPRDRQDPALPAAHDGDHEGTLRPRDPLDRLEAQRLHLPPLRPPSLAGPPSTFERNSLRLAFAHVRVLCVDDRLLRNCRATASTRG